MRTSTNRFLLLTIALFAGVVGCSTGEGGGSSEGGGQACEGEGCDCSNEPLDCIEGTFYEDENGCRACDYWECQRDICPEGSSPQCTGDGVVVCNGHDGGCDEIDTSDPDLPACSDRYACVDAAWTCACPTAIPEEGAPCDDLGQSCVVTSDLDCGPPAVTIACTASGWNRIVGEGAGGGGGGTDCG